MLPADVQKTNEKIDRPFAVGGFLTGLKSFFNMNFYYFTEWLLRVVYRYINTNLGKTFERVEVVIN